MSRTDPQTLLPLTAPVFHVLLALGDSPKHGYAIMQWSEDRTGGRDAILPGTLYATIGRMKEAGLLEELAEAPPDSTDRRRRYYGVTAFGREVAFAESERLARLLAVARSVDLAPEIVPDAR